MSILFCKLIHKNARLLQEFTMFSCLSQTNPVHPLPFYFLKINFNIITKITIAFMPKSSNQSLCFSFCYQICPIHDFKTKGHKQKNKKPKMLFSADIF